MVVGTKAGMACMVEGSMEVACGSRCWEEGHARARWAVVVGGGSGAR